MDTSGLNQTATAASVWTPELMFKVALLCTKVAGPPNKHKQSRVDSDAAQVLASSPKDVPLCWINLFVLHFVILFTSEAVCN